MLQSLSTSLFSKPEFKEGIVRAFVKVGLAEDENGEFVKYTAHTRGSILPSLAPADSPSIDQFTLGGGELVGELDPDSNDKPDSDDEPNDDPNDVLAAAGGPDEESQSDGESDWQDET